MEQTLKALLLTFLLSSSSVFADNLILSNKLSLEYPSPLVIGHGGSYLLVKYEDWSFSHQHFDPKTFYQQIDLTGLEKDFVRSIFDHTRRKQLPDWLSVVSKEFAEGLEFSPDSIHIFKVGDAEILTGHDQEDHGLIYIIEDLVIHQISITGTTKDLDLIAKNIKER